MQYRKDRCGNDLSVLGYGCMRFSRKGNRIDLPKAEKEIMAAFEAGVNYYDTAYIYPGSEEALGEILHKNNIRDKVNIASKLPQYLITDAAAVDRYFSEELTRLKTDHIDYYLMHHLTDIVMWEKLKAIGIREWIAARKEEGKIGNIGFSYHGNTDGFLKILNDYDWDFCQIQYNYIDEVTQAGVEGLRAAYAKGIPVIIMEPLRGGKLINMLPRKARDLIAGNGRGYSAAEWAFRWLYDQPEVTVVLSGMNSLEMVEQNVKTASEAKAGSFTSEDHAFIGELKKLINENEKVGCTGCRYCMPCPRGVDIPGYFKCWNTMYTENKDSGRKQFFQTVALSGEPAFASLCVECGKCEKHCPQSIEIRKKLKEADRDLRGFPYNIILKIARRYMLRKAKR